MWQNGCGKVGVAKGDGGGEGIEKICRLLKS